MDLDWLKDFLALAEIGNFSRAADHRNVTQPAFSRRIRALEEWVGTPLFVRGAQGAELTAAGLHFRPAAEELMRQIERIRRETAAVGERQARSLTIAATHALSFTFFPGWIRRHISLEGVGALSLVSDSMEACEDAMLAGQVHFLLCHHHRDAQIRLDSERFASVEVGTDTLVPVCAPDAKGRPIWPIPSAPGRRTRLLDYSPASGLGRILRADPPIAKAATALETVFHSDLAATLSRMARDGEGAAWLPRLLVGEEIEAGRLVRAGDASLDVPVSIMLFRSPAFASAAADALWQALNGDAQTGEAAKGRDQPR